MSKRSTPYFMCYSCSAKLGRVAEKRTIPIIQNVIDIPLVIPVNTTKFLSVMYTLNDLIKVISRDATKVYN